MDGDDFEHRSFPIGILKESRKIYCKT